MHIEKVNYAVEANDFERQCIWEKYHDRCKWEQDICGSFFQIGTLDNRPVTVCLDWVTIDGKKVLFYHSPSQVVDYKLVEEWIRKNALTSAGMKADSANFHIILIEIRRV